MRQKCICCFSHAETGHPILLLHQVVVPEDFLDEGQAFFKMQAHIVGVPPEMVHLPMARGVSNALQDAFEMGLMMTLRRRRAIGQPGVNSLPVCKFRLPSGWAGRGVPAIAQSLPNERTVGNRE